ncbi:MAG: IS110 family transposase [Deltaproteobacteria bacterium]|nr:IS110 family transposase [Deltaproteobacteria bacterium]
MQMPKYFVGIDIASDSFTVAIHQVRVKPATLSNCGEGFEELPRWLKANGVNSSNAIICMEATGVYTEYLCYFLHSKGFSVAVEAPQKVRRAFCNDLHKNDSIDSMRIAEYACRFHDQLPLWTPSQEIVEQVKALLAAREQLTGHLVANRNALKAIERKYVKTPLAEKVYLSSMEHIKEQIRLIDKELKNLISNHPTISRATSLMTGIPGVGTLLACNILVATQGFTRPLNARQLASHIGICPFERQSGASVHRRPRYRRYGPERLRKLLYLAALSLRTHNEAFKRYFLRKVEEGKSKRLVLNNIANRLLRIMTAVLKTQTPFIKGFKSLNPTLLCNA